MVSIKSVLNALAYGIALLGFVPLFPYLEPAARLLFPAAVVFGALADRRGRPVHGRLPTVISLLFFLFYAARFSRDDLVGPAVNLLVILLAVRLISEKCPRNYLQIYALSLFLLAGSTLFSLSPLFLVYFLVMLLLIAVSLVILTFYSAASSKVVSRPAMKKILSVALLLPGASLPLILLFFFILPRTQYPLWNFLNVGGAKVTGFSEKVEPGSAPAVGEVRNVAFRASCGKLPKNLLYWRGIVLNAFEGKAWVRREPPGTEDGFAGKGETFRQTIFPEPGRASYLLALNIPRTISGVRFTASPDGTYVRRGAPSGHVKYEVLSALSDTIASRKEVDRDFYRALPPRLSPRMNALAASIAEKGKDDAGKVLLLGEFYRDGKLTYATSGLPVGEEPLDEFLFEKKRGHCEFFASSFAILLRAAGVPARLVGGYHGGEYNELGGYYVITEDMAHVWVEAHIAGKGWVTIDPSSWAVNSAGIGAHGQRGVARTFSMALDALGYYWNLAVINYDLERQLRLIAGTNEGLKRLAVPLRLKRLASAALLAVIAAVVLIGLIRRGRVTREERIVRAFIRQARREYGIEAGPETGLQELAATLNDPCAGRFAEIYGGALYRDRRLTPDEIKLLKGLVRGLRNPARKRLSGAYRPTG